jgi:hypothetical protein
VESASCSAVSRDIQRLTHLAPTNPLDTRDKVVDLRVHPQERKHAYIVLVVTRLQD